MEGERRPEAGEGEPEVDVQWIGAGYRDAMRIPLLAGRDVEERDRESSPPVVLVNAAFVRRFLSGDPRAPSAGGYSTAWGSPQSEPADPA